MEARKRPSKNLPIPDLRRTSTFDRLRTFAARAARLADACIRIWKRLVRVLKMMMDLALDPGVEGLAAAEANLHRWILRLYIHGHCFGIELFVFVSVTH